MTTSDHELRQCVVGLRTLIDRLRGLLGSSSTRETALLIADIAAAEVVLGAVTDALQRRALGRNARW
jgi:hypothetical protein